MQYLPSLTMVDLHCHLLPGLDDGPRTPAESRALCRAMVDQGTRTAVATPHVSFAYPNDRAEIHSAAGELREALAADGVPLELWEGAEIELARTRDLSDGELRALTLGGRRWLLVEPPLDPRLPDPVDELESLIQRGHELLLAHPERCPAFQRRPRGLRRLVAKGVLLSITASSLTGAFGRPARELARSAVHQRLVHDVASDAHDAIHRSPAIRRHLDAAGQEMPILSKQATWLTTVAPAAILVGATLPPDLAARR